MEETYQILLGLRERYEAHHKLRYTDEALDSAAKYSSQYISDRFLPDKVSHFTGFLPAYSGSSVQVEAVQHHLVSKMCYAMAVLTTLAAIWAVVLCKLASC